MSDKLVPISHEWTADMWDWPLQRNDGIVKIVNTAEKFEVGLEVPCFKPNEIEVKVASGELVVNCRHELRHDDDWAIAREIHRAYKLPEDVDQTAIKSHLTNRALLVISAAKKK